MGEFRELAGEHWDIGLSMNWPNMQVNQTKIYKNGRERCVYANDLSIFQAEVAGSFTYLGYPPPGMMVLRTRDQGNLAPRSESIFFGVLS
jgi:hypothetical protein